MASTKSPVAKLFADLRKLLSSVKVRWYVFGAQAAIIYGSNRLTSDVDITLDLHGTPVAVLLKALAKYGFEPQIPDRRFIEVTRVIPVVHVKTKLPVDLVLAGPGLEDEFFERVVMITIGSTKIPFASPEDLVVMKVLSGRPEGSRRHRVHTRCTPRHIRHSGHQENVKRRRIRTRPKRPALDLRTAVEAIARHQVALRCPNP